MSILNVGIEWDGLFSDLLSYCLRHSWKLNWNGCHLVVGSGTFKVCIWISASIPMINPQTYWSGNLCHPRLYITRSSDQSLIISMFYPMVPSIRLILCWRLFILCLVGKSVIVSFLQKAPLATPSLRHAFLSSKGADTTRDWLQCLDACLKTQHYFLPGVRFQLGALIARRSCASFAECLLTLWSLSDWISLLQALFTSNWSPNESLDQYFLPNHQWCRQNCGVGGWEGVDCPWWYFRSSCSGCGLWDCHAVRGRFVREIGKPQLPLCSCQS